jgi:hypothetical protein
MEDVYCEATARLQVSRTAFKAAPLILAFEQHLEGAERDDDERESLVEGEVAHVSLDEANARPNVRVLLFELPPRDGEHVR